MTLTPRFLLILISVVLFVVAALWVPPATVRVNLTALGLAFLAAGLLVGP